MTTASAPERLAQPPCLRRRTTIRRPPDPGSGRDPPGAHRLTAEPSTPAPISVTRASDGSVPPAGAVFATMEPHHDTILLTRAMTLLFACACGIVIGNIYYAQPLLAAIARSFGARRPSSAISSR